MEREQWENEQGTKAPPTTRRAILLGGAAGLAAIAASTLAGAGPAEAATASDYMVLGELNNAGADETSIVSSSSDTLNVVNTSGIGLFAYDNGGGEYGTGIGSNVIFAQALGKGDGTGNENPAIFAENSGGGAAIQAQVKAGGPTIIALSSGPEASISTGDSSGYGMGTGPGVSAQLTNPANGSAAVEAKTAGSGPGVEASSKTGAGVNATSNTGNGVQATSKTGTGVVASSSRGTGVEARGGTYGVQASSSSGAGVQAQGGTYGVQAAGDTYGVSGQSDSGTGVYAQSTSGNALQVVGKVAFSTSGLASVPKGGKSVKVNLAGTTTASLVLATIQGAAGTIAVANAVPAKNSFSINLTGAAPSALKVAWFVIG